MVLVFAPSAAFRFQVRVCVGLSRRNVALVPQNGYNFTPKGIVTLGPIIDCNNLNADYPLVKRDRHGRARHMDLGLLGLASVS